MSNVIFSIQNCCIWKLIRVKYIIFQICSYTTYVVTYNYVALFIDWCAA